MLLTIIGIVVSSIISVIFSDKIISIIQTIALKLGIKRNVSLAGVWIATFKIGNEEYREVIRITQRFGRVCGRIEDDHRNYARLHTIMRSKPIRIRGNFVDNLYLTGYWYHPIEYSRHYGAFQLRFDSDSQKLCGKWIGFSSSLKQIDSGLWTWVKDTI